MVNKQDLMDLVSTETILDEGMAPMGGGQPGAEQKLRPNQADRILKSYCENLNQIHILGHSLDPTSQLNLILNIKKRFILVKTQFNK